MELHPKSAIKYKQKTTNYILSGEDEGCDDTVENASDDGNCGYMELDWKIKFSNIVDEKWVSSCHLKKNQTTQWN